MGIPKMSYPPAAMAKIADLKERLKLLMGSVLNTYFPNEDLKFNFDGKINKYKYPAASFEPTNVKKFADCTMCGMCNGDRCSKAHDASEFSANIKGFNPNQTFDGNGNAKNNISKDELEKLISEVVRNVISAR